MGEDQIRLLLTQNNYNLFNLSKLSNGSFRLAIQGDVWVQQIKDLLLVASWAYENGLAVFYIN